jgi:hypothetical protein
MKRTIKKLVLTGVLASVFILEAHASTMTYVLNQSNIESVMPDNVPYLTVTIQDGLTFGSDTNAVKFKVDIINSAFTAGSNFGIGEFGFNRSAGAPAVAESNIVRLASGWNANTPPPNNQLDGFGRFGIKVSGPGNNRLDPLEFWITGVMGDTAASYSGFSTNAGGQGSVKFAAHMAGFKTSGNKITSGYFGGSTAVPIPATLWLFGSALAGLVSIKRRKHA